MNGAGVSRGKGRVLRSALMWLEDPALHCKCQSRGAHCLAFFSM